MTLQDRFDSLFRVLNPRDAWYTCPACSREWNKLQRCEFPIGALKTECVLCVTCATTPNSMKYLQTAYPIPGAEICILKGVGVVSISSLNIRVETHPAGNYVRCTRSWKPDAPEFPADMVRAWAWARDEFERGADPEILPSWGALKKMRGRK